MVAAIYRCLQSIDERLTVKMLLSVWGPPIEFLVRLLLVATFLDDSFRAATHFSEHTKQIGEQGYLKPLAEASPELVSVIAMVFLGIGLLAQSLGALCLLTNLQPDNATKALIGWAIVQPVLYAQLTNFEFVAESLSIVGGLLIFRAHLSQQADRSGRRVPMGGGLCTADDAAPEAAIARMQLLGRVLLPTVYLYHAMHIRLFDSISMFIVNLAVLGGLAVACTLIAAGLKSRTVALWLALINLGFICYQHPFFRFVWKDGDEWKYDEVALRKSMPHVSLPEDSSPDDFQAWHILDLHRYYFFQGLSTSGALLLLTQFGPGELSIELDGVLAKDSLEVIATEKSLQPHRG